MRIIRISFSLSSVRLHGILIVFFSHSPVYLALTHSLSQHSLVHSLCIHQSMRSVQRNLWQVQFKIKLFNYFQRATRVLFRVLGCGFWIPVSGFSISEFLGIPIASVGCRPEKHLQFKCQSQRNLPQGWLPRPRAIVSHSFLLFAFLIDFRKSFCH